MNPPTEASNYEPTQTLPTKYPPTDTSNREPTSLPTDPPTHPQAQVQNTETGDTYTAHLLLVFLQNGLQVVLLLVVEVEVLALRFGLGAHRAGNGRPVAAMLPQPWAPHSTVRGGRQPN